MWKKLLLLVLAAGLTAGVNLRPCCTLSVNGRALEGEYSPGAVTRGSYVAALAADEIVQGRASYPYVKSRVSLCFGRPEGETKTLTDELLKSTPGVEKNEAVYVDGERMGSVSDGAELRERLNLFIINQLPTWAVSGRISGNLELCPQYSRVGQTTNTDDMVLLISGMAPVYYFDGKGYMSRA